MPALSYVVVARENVSPTLPIVVDAPWKSMLPESHCKAKWIPLPKSLLTTYPLPVLLLRVSMRSTNVDVDSPVLYQNSIVEESVAANCSGAAGYASELLPLKYSLAALLRLDTRKSGAVEKTGICCACNSARGNQ